MRIQLGVIWIVAEYLARLACVYATFFDKYNNTNNYGVYRVPL